MGIYRRIRSLIINQRKVQRRSGRDRRKDGDSKPSAFGVYKDPVTGGMRTGKRMRWEKRRKDTGHRKTD